jgi:hypothetical protein
MMNNFDDILLELGYRVPEGIVDLTKEHQVTELVNILKENGYTDANELAQKARVYFSYLNEAKPKVPVDKIMNQTVTNTDTKKKIKVSSALQYKNSDNPGQQAAFQQAQAMFQSAGYNDKEINKIAGVSKPEQPKVSGKSVFGKGKGGKVFEPKDKDSKVDVEKGAAIQVQSSRYATKGSKELDQKKANNRLKALPPSGISTEKALSNFKKAFPNATTTKYEFPKSSDKLLREKLPPAGYDALKSVLKMSKQGDFEPPISMITDQYGAGKISAQANELAMQAVYSFPSTQQGMAARAEFIKSLETNADVIEKAGGVPILDKSWIRHMAGAHDAFIKNMNRQYGSGRWEVTGMTWDVRQQQEALGANYDNKGDSTDINAQVRIAGKQIQNIEISCKKDWNIFLLNAGLGEPSNWFYTLGPQKEMRANELSKMKEAKDPRFGKQQEAELKELSKQALSKAPIKNKELQDNQLSSAKKGFELIKEIPNKDFAASVKDCMSRGKNDPLYMDKNEAELAKKVQKFLNGTKELNMDDFASYIGGGAKDFKKAVMVYHKLLGSYSGDTNWLESHKQITYGFVQESAKKMATNKEFQGMLLKKLQEAIPVKTMVEGIETMQIDGMYITQKHMQEMFGTDKWDNIKEYLGIKVTNGVASLTYSAKGVNKKPLKIANIQMREKGVGYNGSIALECLPSKEFETTCKDIDSKINRKI